MPYKDQGRPRDHRAGERHAAAAGSRREGRGEVAASRPTRCAFVYAPTQSLAGGVQVVGRVLEVALHKAHELHFPLENIVDGIATAPLSPPHPDFVTGHGPHQ